MPVSKKQQACVSRYRSKHYDHISITVPKGERDRYKNAAERLGVSVNQLFINAVEEIIADRLVGVDLSNAPTSDTTESTE